GWTFVASPASSTADDDAYTGDESITRHAPPVAPYGDESITADAPVTRPRPLTSNDDTESVTTRGPSRGASKVASARSVPSDDDSVATEIAVSPIATTLRVHPSGEHVRAGVPVASGAVRQRERAPDLAPHAPVRIPDGGGSAAYASDRPADDADEGPPPRYAVLVAVVAFLSLAIPVGLFLYLHDGRAGEPPAPAEVVADPVRRGDPPRAKMTKGAPSPGASGELRRP
ncbi:MAG TPA: hypothetical protein VM925_03195, partial [Labilithrix sp.]|nr:hypothetical protein [Labilithrix sp.]